MGYNDEFQGRLAAALKGDVTFSYAAGFRDETRRARAAAEQVRARWTGWTALSSTPKHEVDEALAKVNSSWDALYGSLVTRWRLQSEDDWQAVPVSWVPGVDSYDGRAEALVDSLGRFYVTLDSEVATFGNTSAAGDAAGAAAGVGNFAKDLEKELLSIAKPLAIAAGVLVGIVVLANVLPLILKKG